MSCTRVKWHAQFKANQTSTDDDKHSGKPISFTIPDIVIRIQQLIHDIADEVRVGMDMLTDYDC